MNIEPLAAKEIATLRENHGLTQSEFWSRLCMTQGAGSRLEDGSRHASAPLSLLLSITYGTVPMRAVALNQLQLTRFMRARARARARARKA